MADQAIALFAWGMHRGRLGLSLIRMAAPAHLSRRLGQHRLEFTAVCDMAAQTFSVTIRRVDLTLSARPVRMTVETEGVGLFF